MSGPFHRQRPLAVCVRRSRDGDVSRLAKRASRGRPSYLRERPAGFASRRSYPELGTLGPRRWETPRAGPVQVEVRSSRSITPIMDQESAKSHQTTSTGIPTPLARRRAHLLVGGGARDSGPLWMWKVTSGKGWNHSVLLVRTGKAGQSPALRRQQSPSNWRCAPRPAGGDPWYPLTKREKLAGFILILRLSRQLNAEERSNDQ